MARSAIKVQLAYTVEQDGFEREPYEVTREWPITEYVVGSANSVPGQAILGLEATEDIGVSYTIRRLENRIAFDFDTEDILTVINILFKINWSDPTDQIKPITACYLVEEDKREDDDIKDMDNMMFLLKQDENDPSLHRLVYVIPPGGGAADPCEVLEDRGVDCQNPATDAEEIACEKGNCN